MKLSRTFIFCTLLFAQLSFAQSNMNHHQDEDARRRNAVMNSHLISLIFTTRIMVINEEYSTWRSTRSKLALRLVDEKNNISRLTTEAELFRNKGPNKLAYAPAIESEIIVATKKADKTARKLSVFKISHRLFTVYLLVNLFSRSAILVQGEDEYRLFPEFKLSSMALDILNNKSQTITENTEPVEN